MSDSVNCFICNSRDVKSVMQRIKGHGYTHQTCLELALDYGIMQLRKEWDN